MMRLWLAFALLCWSLIAGAVDVFNYVPVYGGNANLGADGVETTSAPFRTEMDAAGTPSGNYVQVALAGGRWTEVGRFYTPAYASSTVVQASSRFYLMACEGSQSVTIEAGLYDYDPVSGTKTSLASAVRVTLTSSCTSVAQNIFSFANSQATVPAGHRLLVTLQAYPSRSGGDTLRVYDASSGTNSVLTVVEGAGSAIGNCLAAGTYSSSWGVLRVFGSSGAPRTDYGAGETINFQFGSYQAFGSTSSTKNNLFAATRASTGTTYASSRSLTKTGTLYSASTSALSISGHYNAYLLDISDYKPNSRSFVNILPLNDNLKFYSDSAYSVQTDTFASTDRVYAVLSNPAINFTGVSLRIYDFNNSYSSVTASNVVAKNGLLKFSFVPGTRLANGDWGAMYVQVSASNMKSKVYYRNLRRLDSGCVYCSASAPYDVSVQSTTPSSITLSWTPNWSDNGSYTIYRNGALIASNVRTSTYTDTSLAQGTVYTYTVRGASGTCESLDSNPVNAETQSNPGAFNARDCGTGTCGSTRSDGSSPATDNKIRTKIAGTAFDVEVVATVNGFNKWSQVTAELWDASDSSGALDATTNCFSSYKKISPSAVALTAKGGKEVATFTVSEAYRNVVVKALFSGSPASAGCSLDHFAIRPASFTNVAIKDSDWLTAGNGSGGRSLNNSSATSGTIHRAGRPFYATATAVNSAGNPTILYNGQPEANISALVQPTPASCADCVPGDLNFGTWSANAGVLTTTTATYSEAGSFTMTLDDNDFAAVDAGDGSTDIERTISSAAMTVGRFVPDAYDLASDGSAPTLTASCSGAALLGQPLAFSHLPIITAQPRAYDGTAIQNLTGSLARTSSDITTSAAWSPTPSAGSITKPAVAEDGANPGTYLLTLGASDTLGYARPSLPSSGPFCINSDSTGACAGLTRQSLTLDVGLVDTYSDGTVTGSLSGTDGVLTNATVSPAGSPFYFGRLALYSALGTEMVPLPVRAEVQVWSGSAFQPLAGTCTSPTLSAGQIAVSFPSDTRNKLTACSSTQLSMTSGNLSTLKLSAPGAGNTGWADLTWNVNATASGTTCTGSSATTATTAAAPWLGTLNAAGTAYDANPTARARFGVRAMRRALFIQDR